jgi:hypothetical protein
MILYEFIDSMLDEEDRKKLDNWINQQPDKPTGATGGRLQYIFIPTTLGLVFKVKDSLTKDEIDLTHYEDW